MLTIDSCFRCNQSTSRYENLVWILLALVGRHPVLTEYRAAGGKVERALAREPSLRDVIDSCKNSEGHYDLIGEMRTACDRILRKTAQGLYYGVYDRVPPLANFELLSIEHSDYQTAEAVVEKLRRPALRDITDEPLPSITSRGLPNVFILQAVLTNPLTGESHVTDKVLHDVRQEDVEWIVYQPGTLRFAFFQDEDGNAICVMDLWGTLIAAVKAPWPNRRGVLRKGRNNPNARP